MAFSALISHNGSRVAVPLHTLESDDVIVTAGRGATSNYERHRDLSWSDLPWRNTLESLPKNAS